MNGVKPTAVVTGAAQGIGRTTAEFLAERGYRLALIDLEAPEDTLKCVQSQSAEALSLAGSVAEEAAVERFASPDDVARAIAFLADERESGFINGHALAVDGGWTADGSWETLRLRHR